MRLRTVLLRGVFIAAATTPWWADPLFLQNFLILALHFDEHPVLMLAIIVAAGYAMATLSWNLLEKPFLRLKGIFESTPLGQTGAGSLCGCVRKEN